MALNQPEILALLVEVIIVLLIVRRSVAMAQGVAYSLARLLVAPALLLFIWVLSELEALLLISFALPYLLVVDVLILLASAIGFARVAERRAVVTQDASGGWRYQIGFSVTVVFLVVFLVRLALAVAFYPSSLEFTAPTSGLPSFSEQIILAGIDSALSASVGLLVGRSVGVARKVRAARTAAPRTGAGLPGR